LVTKLLEKGANQDIADKFSGDLPIHLLARSRKSLDEDFYKNICSLSSNLNARDKDGWTPLHKACYYRNTRRAYYLLLQGADRDC